MGDSNTQNQMGGAPAGFDPERMNEEMMQRLPTFMGEVQEIGR
jgi:hypothetical protein